jgi:Mor family transcriptional regulator
MVEELTDVLLSDEESNILFNELSSDMQLVATHCGLSVALSLQQNLPGIRIDIPKKKEKPLKNKLVKIDYKKGLSVKELALKYSICERRVQQIITEY